MKHFIIFISFFIFSFGSFAQQDFEGIQIDSTQVSSNEFDEQSIEKYRNSDDFNYNVQKKEENILDRFWNWLGRLVKKGLSWVFDDISPALGLIKDFLSILPYILLAVLLYFILKFFLKIDTNSLKNKNAKIAAINITDEEELIKNSDLQELVNQSVTNKNYRLAVRYYYLLILQKLADKELIVWQQEKTNEDYIKELQATKVHQQFTESTRLYDFVWYGNFDINETEFTKAASLFTNLKSKIGE